MNMKRYRKWLCIALCLIVVELGCAALFNYIIDPYGLFRYGTFRKDFSYQFIEPAKNFIKTRYVAQHPEMFDCFIFGSSRVNNIDVRKIPGATCYNMHLAGGLPRNNLDNLRYWLKEGVKPKIIIIGLDEFSYKMDPEEHLTHFLNHPYPPVLNQSLLLYYLKYLLYIFSGSVREPILEGFMGKRQPIIYDHYVTGLNAPPKEVDRYIEEHPKEHANDPKFNNPFHVEGDYMKGALQDIRETVQLAKTHGTRVVVLINPIHHTTFLDTDLAQFLRFEKALSAITDFWDFSGLNSITTNNYYYYETSHYRPMVGDMMIARIFGDGKVKVPADFGVLVTPENVDRHLEDLRQQVANKASRGGPPRP